MLRRAVALVPGEAVLGVEGVLLDHVPVPGHLGQDGRGADGVGQSVPVDEGVLPGGDVQAPQGVDEHVGDGDADLGEGLLEAPLRGLQDVDLVDGLRVDPGGGVGQGGG